MEKKLSVVVSVYNEEQALPMFYETIKLILEILPWDYELLFVNDGSRDDSLSILREYAARDEKVKVVSFSRNFGHEAAMIAGIDYADGDGDRPIFFMFAIRYLCKCQKERSTDHIKNIIMKEFDAGYVPEIPDYAIDMHTIQGRARGRDVFYFLDEASKVQPLWEKYDDSYRLKLYDICKKEAEQNKEGK